MRRGKSFSLRTMGNFCEGATVPSPAGLPGVSAAAAQARGVFGDGSDGVWEVRAPAAGGGLVVAGGSDAGPGAAGVVLVLHRFPRALMVWWMRLAPCVPADR